MSTQVGTGHIYGLATLVIAIGSINGYVSPNVTTAKATHSGDVDRIKSDAIIKGLISSGDEKIEMAFDFIPEHPTSISGANLSAALPVILSFVTISNMPVIPIGSFADGYNSTLWLYEGGGSIHGVSDKHWTASFTLHRYLGITSATVTAA